MIEASQGPLAGDAGERRQITPVGGDGVRAGNALVREVGEKILGAQPRRIHQLSTRPSAAAAMSPMRSR